mgnify:CR=1 FL=1
MADSSVSSSTWRDAALVILGHGSTQNPDSSTPTWQHADELRRRGLFREVQCAFWKEEPGFREVMHMIDSDHVFVVPNFISEGYFTRDVLPRELELQGPVTHAGGRTIRYCDPVGIHPSMTRLLLKRAAEIAPGVPLYIQHRPLLASVATLTEQPRHLMVAGLWSSVMVDFDQRIGTSNQRVDQISLAEVAGVDIQVTAAAVLQLDGHISIAAAGIEYPSAADQQRRCCGIHAQVVENVAVILALQ